MLGLVDPNVDIVRGEGGQDNCGRTFLGLTWDLMYLSDSIKHCSKYGHYILVCSACAA